MNVAADAPRLRVAITRDEAADGPLSTALRGQGFEPFCVAVSREAPLPDASTFAAVVGEAERYGWIVFVSVRAVEAFAAARGVRGWPRSVRAAAVGGATAAALVSAGADPAPLTGERADAAALLQALRRALGPVNERKRRARVLVLTVAGGRRTVAEGLRADGASVDEIEAYHMEPRPEADVVRAWRAADPAIVIVTSPSAGEGLARALGPEALGRVRLCVAIGRTTGDALHRLGVACHVAPRPEFEALAAFTREALGE